MHTNTLSLNSTICMDHINCYLTIVCPDSMFFCHHGRVNDEQPACISTDQRCDGTIDCIGGEDELDHNCPCGPEGAVRLVDGIVPHRGRVEFCKNGRWSTICTSRYYWFFYYYYYWDDNDAAVVCHQLGYRRTGTYVNL